MLMQLQTLVNADSYYKTKLNDTTNTLFMSMCIILKEK